MNSLATRFLTALFVCLLCLSCVKQRPTTHVLAESQALEFAKREFGKTGRKVEDYRITVENGTNDESWVVWFDLNVQNSPPGSTHAVRVEKKTGRVVFMPGE